MKRRDLFKKAFGFIAAGTGAAATAKAAKKDPELVFHTGDSTPFKMVTPEVIDKDGWVDLKATADFDKWERTKIQELRDYHEMVSRKLWKSTPEGKLFKNRGFKRAPPRRRNASTRTPPSRSRKSSRRTC